MWKPMDIHSYVSLLAGTVTNFDPYRTQAGLDDDSEIRFGNKL